MAARSRRDDLVEPSLADHHAAGVLAEMPRQILDALPQIAEQADARIVEREADVADLPSQRVLRIGPLEMVHDLREPIDPLGLDRQRFADLARRARARGT